MRCKILRYINFLNYSILFYDDDAVAMERLPAQLGTVRVRWNQRHSHPTGESLEAGHRAFQQVRWLPLA